MMEKLEKISFAWRSSNKMVGDGSSRTTPMHTDRRELIGYDAKVVCGG
jgi:hypothetical protein